MTDSTTIDYRDLRPKDRRQEPRRVEDRNLHYATEVLLAVACHHADRLLDEQVSDEAASDSMLALIGAVEVYRQCADAASPARGVTE
jgi:hypothetical protein